MKKLINLFENNNFAAAYEEAINQFIKKFNLEDKKEFSKKFHKKLKELYYDEDFAEKYIQEYESMGYYPSDLYDDDEETEFAMDKTKVGDAICKMFKIEDVEKVLGGIPVCKAYTAKEAEEIYKDDPELLEIIDHFMIEALKY